MDSQQQLIKLAMLFDAYGFIAHAQKIIGCKTLENGEVIFGSEVKNENWFQLSSKKYMLSFTKTFFISKYEYLKTFLRVLLPRS